jgi:ParB-like chromosome segregation protein Spo0J
MKIDLVDIHSIRPANWRATHILLPDLKLLTASMIEAGWLSPVVARVADRTIIDGFARWLVPQNSKEFVKKHGDWVPVVWVDIDEIDAMILHVRMNRARGNLVARFMSPLIQEILASRKYSEDELKKMLKMGEEELNLLLDGDLIKQKKVKEHQYEKAWVPVEVPANAVQTSIVLERPPNPDR